MITSVQNTLIKQIIALRDSKERRSAGLTLIDGVREIARALDAGINFKQLVYCKSMFNTRGEEDLLQRMLDASIEAVEVNERVFERISFGERVEGVLAIIQSPVITLEQLKLSAQPIVIVLESVEKPGNLGAMLRSCDGAGVEAVLVCDTKTDIYNPNVIRASTGIVFSLPVVADSRVNISSFLKAKGITTVASSPHAKDVYTKANFKKATAFVFGCEDKGLSREWLMLADSQIKIPMLGKADSLNVSVSCALLVYEALRQRS